MFSLPPSFFVFCFCFVNSSFWTSGTRPGWQDLRDAVIVSLYKNKGEKSDCSNYRGITLLSIAGRIMTRVFLNRLIPMIAQQSTPESQCGLRSNRGTVDMIFVLRQIQEKCREQNMGLYATFVDLTKAFDTVSRDGLWKILARLGCPPPQFLIIFRQLHEGQQGQVKHNGPLSDSFPISNGVKQGCVLAPYCSPSYSASCSVRQKATSQRHLRPFPNR